MAGKAGVVEKTATAVAAALAAAAAVALLSAFYVLGVAAQSQTYNGVPEPIKEPLSDHHSILRSLASKSKSTEELEPKPMPPYESYCLPCLCQAATGCNATYGCGQGYCGPFKISRIYWKEADQVTMPNDDPERPGAYQDCAKNYRCASKIVISYMSKLAQDCNDDDEIDCDDLIMIHYNGGYYCQTPLNRSEVGKEYEERYQKCKSKALNPTVATEDHDEE